MKSGQSRLREWWWRTQFGDTWGSLLFCPFYFSRTNLQRAMRKRLAQLRGRVLDVGCGRCPYRDLIPASEYVGLDVDTPTTRALGAADLYYDGKVLPVVSGSFDAVVCSQVLEHVFEPEKFLLELHRVLRVDGLLVLTVPFVWDEHEQPFDYARYSSFGLRALLERCGFQVLELEKTAADFGALVQLGSAWIFKITRSRFRAWNWAIQMGVIFPINTLGALVRLILPRNEDFYLDNVVLARKSIG